MRLAALREKRARRGGGGGRHLSPGARSRPRQRGGAARARAAGARCPSTSCRSRPSSSRSTRRATSGRSWSTSTRSWCATRWIRRARSSCFHQIGELYEIAGEDGDRRSRTYDRALREEPGLKETQTRLERLARTLDRWKDLVELYHAVAEQVAKSSGDVELQTQLLTRIAQIEETQLGDNDAAAAAYHRVLEVVAAQPRRGQRARGDLPAHRRLHQAGRRRAGTRSRSSPTSPRRRSCCFKAAQIYEEVLENADRAIDVYRQVLSLDENDRQAIDALERLYIRLERWEPLKDVYSKKAELATAPDEKKQMLFVLGQVYDRELKDVDARDRDLPDDPRSRSRGRHRDPGARSALSAGRALVRPARRSSSARSSCRRRRARRSRSSTASASCGRRS